MRDVKDMEAEAARVAAMTPDERARHDTGLLAHRRSLGLEPAAVMTPEQAWQDLAEKDDRTAPPEYPEMVLISFTELSGLMYGATLSRAEAGLIAERRRQVLEEGWTAEHDDEHGDGSLAIAAACYAAPDSIEWGSWTSKARRSLKWPWERRWWKPKDRRLNLVRAGSLIIAEIERLDRAIGRGPGRPVPHHGSGP